MKDEKVVKEFFRNPFAVDYIKYCDYITRLAVTRISASCEMIEDLLKRRVKGDTDGYTDEILAVCRDLVRISELSTVLASQDDDVVITDIDFFLDDFASGCKNALGDNVDVKLDEKSYSFVKTDENVLRFLMLNFVRKAALAAKEGSFKIEIGAEKDETSVIIYMRTDVDFSSDVDDMHENDKLLDSYSDTVFDIIAERLGVSYETNGSLMKIIIMKASDKGESLLRNPRLHYDDGTFSTYNIMLGDLSGQ